MRYHVSQQLEKVRTGTLLQAQELISLKFLLQMNKLTPVIVIILIKTNVPEWYK